MSFDGWMVKQTVIYADQVILLSNKNEWTTDILNDSDESPENYTEWKVPIPKNYILFDPIHIIFLK